MTEAIFGHLTQYLGATSGHTVFEPFGAFSPDTVVTRAVVTLAGKGFAGSVKDFSGLTFRSAGVDYKDGAWAPSPDTTKSWIIDFGCSVSLASVEVNRGTGGSKPVAQVKDFASALERAMYQSGANDILLRMITQEKRKPSILKDSIASRIENGVKSATSEKELVADMAEEVCALVEKNYSGESSRYGKMYAEFGADIPVSGKGLDEFSELVVSLARQAFEKIRDVLSTLNVHINHIFSQTGNGFDLTPFYSHGAVASTVAIFPETVTSKILVSFSSSVKEEDLPELLMVTVTNLPTAVRVSIGDRPPFYVSGGSISGPEALPDFSGEINAWLSGLKGQSLEGPYPVYLNVLQGSASVITVQDAEAVVGLEGVCKKDGSETFQLDIETQSKTLFDLEFPVSSPESSNQGKSLAISGITISYGSTPVPWSACPQNVPEPGASPFKAVSVKPGAVLAQAVKPGAARDIYGAMLCLKGLEKTSELFLDLYEAGKNKPAGPVLCSTPFSIDRQDKPAWVNVLFPQCVTLPSGFSDDSSLFLVLRIGSGAVEWGFEECGADVPGLLLDSGDGIYQLLATGGKRHAGGHRLLVARGAAEGMLSFQLNGLSIPLNPDETNGRVTVSPELPVTVIQKDGAYRATASVISHTGTQLAVCGIRFSYSFI